MAAQSFVSHDETSDGVEVRYQPGRGARQPSNSNALVVMNLGIAGNGSALFVKSDNATTPAAIVQGAGDLLDLRDGDGVSVYRVGQDGTLTVGDVVGAARTVYKTDDESVTSSTTVQDDDHLTLTMTTDAVYALDTFLDVEGDADGDFKLTFTGPSGASGSWTPDGISLGNSNNIGQIKRGRNGFGDTDSVGILPDGTIVTPRGQITTSSTAGSLTLQWAQNSSNETATTLKTGSWLRLHRMA